MFRVSPDRYGATLSLFTGRQVGREDFPNKPDKMSTFHFHVLSIGANHVQIRHYGKRDGLVEYANSGLHLRVSRDDETHRVFMLNVDDVYKPMQGFSLRLQFAIPDDGFQSEHTLPYGETEAVDSDKTLPIEEESSHATSEPAPPADPITIADVTRTVVRGYIHSARRQGREKASDTMTLMCGNPNQAQKKKLADLKDQHADTWSLKHQEYLTTVLEDGLMNNVNINKLGVKEQLLAQQQNEELDMMVRQGHKRFYHPESGFIGLTKKMKDERDDMRARIKRAMERSVADPEEDIEEIDDVIDKTDDEGEKSDGGEEADDEDFIVDDAEPVHEQA